jgi:flagellar M-ring protein FliF
VAQLLRNLGEAWRRVSIVHRVLLLAVVLACVGITVLLASWLTKPNMVVLYGGLRPEEAGQIGDEIRDRGVRFEVTGGGTTILVPEEDVYSLRLGLAQDGLPTGSDGGYKVLDDERLGSSPFTQRVNYNRAREAVLARTIEEFDSVVSARVHIVQQETALFAGDEKEASASVMVRLAGGRALGEGSVWAIVHLVAGAVRGLRPSNIAVTDTQGSLLSGEPADELAGKAGNFHEHRTRVERDLAKKAEQMLATALGPNRASVRVSVKMKTTAVTTSKETYDAEKRVMTSESLTNKSTTGTEGAGAGMKETQTETAYVPSKVIEQTEEVPGDIISKSVAALVDLTPRKDPDGHETEAMTKEDVEGLIKSALGLKTKDEGGEDFLSVVTARFPAPAAALAPDDGGMFTPDFMLDVAKRMSLGLLVIGALVALKILTGKGKKKAKAEGEGEAAEAGGLALPGGGQAGNLLPAAGEAAGQEMLRARITQALQNNPEEVKRLFLSWAESEGGRQ